jgi:hypothetical protein
LTYQGHHQAQTAAPDSADTRHGGHAATVQKEGQGCSFFYHPLPGFGWLPFSREVRLLLHHWQAELSGEVYSPRDCLRSAPVCLVCQQP